ncbi:MAG: phosphopantetheine-binding protein [Pseudomonadota bacterium]
MSDSVFETTSRIIAEKAEMDAADITAETTLSDIDIQSLELAEIIFDLEDAFEIEIEMNAATAWQKLKTVGDVTSAIQALVSADGATTS